MRDLRCGNGCRRRAQGCTILKVTEQHRLMARHLPDQLELGPCRNPGDLSVAPRHLPPFIAVKKNKLLLFGNYNLPFQIIGALILVATIGVIVLSKRELR